MSEKSFKYVIEAIALIMAKEEERKLEDYETEAEFEKSKNQGIIDCPKCGQALRYTIMSNGHVWGRCSTDGCLTWMQ